MPTLAPRHPLSQHRWKLVGFIAVLIGIALAASWFWSRNAETRAIRAIPEQERRALYARTLQTLESTCRPDKRPSGLEDFCRRQAEWIVEFPECDAACSALARSYFRLTPSR